MSEAIELLKVKCCGIAEINNLSYCNSPQAALIGLYEKLKTGIRWREDIVKFNFPFVMYSGVVERGGRRYHYVSDLTAYIKANNLGPVVETIERLNWTMNNIQVCIWSPDYAVLFPLVESLIRAEKDRAAERALQMAKWTAEREAGVQDAEKA